jgi:hypothetical protein
VLIDTSQRESNPRIRARLSPAPRRGSRRLKSRLRQAALDSFDFHEDDRAITEEVVDRTEGQIAAHADTCATDRTLRLADASARCHQARRFTEMSPSSSEASMSSPPHWTNAAKHAQASVDLGGHRPPRWGMALAETGGRAQGAPGRGLFAGGPTAPSSRRSWCPSARRRPQRHPCRRGTPRPSARRRP